MLLMFPWLLIYHLQTNESASISPSLEPENEPELVYHLQTSETASISSSLELESEPELI